MKIIICGGRDFRDYELLSKYMDGFHKQNKITLVIHGGSKGADKLAGEWAWSRGISYKIYHAEWDKYGKSAGPIRNKQMLMEKPDCVIAFPGGAGTKNMCELAEDAKIMVHKL